MDKVNWKREVLLTGGLILLVLLLFKGVFNLSAIMGDSMEPSLASGEKVVGLRLGKLQRFEIVTFHAPDEAGANYVKRIIGLPGDQISYRDDQLYVNGEKLAEPYLQEEKEAVQATGTQLTPDFSYQVPTDEYFVMGDNRQVSKDSRMFGGISSKAVIGDVRFVLWPLTKLGAPR